MTTVNYLDGTSLTSTQLSNEQIETAFQVATCQMLGIVVFAVDMTLTSGSNIATPASMANLAVGQLIIGTGIPDQTTITVVGASTITMSANATANGVQSITAAQPDAYSLVRIGWMQQGQPGPNINSDTCFVRCAPLDTDFGRMRDVTGSANSTTITQTDVFTRAWRTFWTFYGPNSLPRACAVRSALIKIDFVANLLAQSNLYIQPSIAEPLRNPENFQGDWWERVDLAALFNEQVTETHDVNADASVEVIGYNKDGQFTDFTVQLP
jgi:hypothetical protein